LFPDGALAWNFYRHQQNGVGHGAREFFIARGQQSLNLYIIAEIRSKSQLSWKKNNNNASSYILNTLPLNLWAMAPFVLVHLPLNVSVIECV